MTSFENVLGRYGFPPELADPGEFRIDGTVSFVRSDGDEIPVKPEDAARLLKSAVQMLGRSADPVEGELEDEDERRARRETNREVRRQAG